MKAILHNWSDDECIRILANLRCGVTGPGRMFIVEFIVPGPRQQHFAKLFDVHMMCWGPGRERTAAEHADPLTAGGWASLARTILPRGCGASSLVRPPRHRAGKNA